MAVNPALLSFVRAALDWRRAKNIKKSWSGLHAYSRAFLRGDACTNRVIRIARLLILYAAGPSRCLLCAAYRHFLISRARFVKYAIARKHLRGPQQR